MKKSQLLLAMLAFVFAIGSAFTTRYMVLGPEPNTWDDPASMTTCDACLVPDEGLAEVLEEIGVFEYFGTDYDCTTIPTVTQIRCQCVVLDSEGRPFLVDAQHTPDNYQSCAPLYKVPIQ